MGKLEMKNLTKTFNPGTVNEKTALSGLSLTVEDGDFITIVGSNGAGKSTLFHAIAGVFYVDGGSIVLDGEDITYKPEYRRSREMGRLFQDPMRGTAPHMTIEEKFGAGLSPYCQAPERHFSAVPARRTGPFSGISWPGWTWGWKTGCASRWGCSPADSARL